MENDIAPQWKPVPAVERRILGVLVEKAKTTPDTYPLSLNALCTGCNQKNNRHPVMNLEPDDLEMPLERLRNARAIGLVEGSGRVQKYRHYLKDWLGVDHVELAVMAELLLRGAQTEGELRGRAARMEPIADLSALRPVLNSLKAKGLVLSLTPEGRGHVVTHALYEPRELERVKAEAAANIPSDPDVGRPAYTRVELEPAPPARPAPAESGLDRRQLDELRAEISQLRDDLQRVAELAQQNQQQIESLRTMLGG